MRQLGHLEARVMDAAWSAPGPVSVREVHARLREEHDVAYTTVQTVTENLHGKGLLARSKDGRAYRYSPTVGREDHAAELMADALQVSSDRAGTLLRFARVIEAAEAAVLRRALDDRAHHPLHAARSPRPGPRPRT